MRTYRYWIAGVIVTLCLGCFFCMQFQLVAKQRAKQILSGVVIVLDPGHGGRDDGAQAGSVKEQAINLKIASYLKEQLEAAGCTIILTRDDDYDLAEEGATNRKRSDMENRMTLINEKDTDLFLSIHLNSYTNASAKGAQAFYKKGDEASKIFADIVQKHLKQLTKTKMTNKVGDYYILNNAEKVGVLVECGFLSNAEDRAKLIDEEYQKKVAERLYDSIVEYLCILVE